MIQLQFLAHVDEEKCSGCKQCEPICPSGAIKIEEKKAIVDGDRCIDCQRCIDRCKKENAISRAPRTSEVIRYVDHTDLDQQHIKTLCGKAGISASHAGLRMYPHNGARSNCGHSKRCHNSRGYLRHDRASRGLWYLLCDEAISGA